VKLLVISDLHLEAMPDWVWPRTLPEFDVAVIAGDIAGSCTASVEALTMAAPLREKPIVFVPGNHEHYHHIIQDDLAEGRTAAAGTNVHLLAGDAVTIHGVRFIGATLWTDYRLFGSAKKSMVLAGQEMPDHAAIRIREGDGPDAHISRFMPWHAAAMHRQDLAFLVEELSALFNGSTAVITHHLPSARSIGVRFQGSALNAAFASDLEWLIDRTRPELWVHGHTHESCDYRLRGTRILCNPKGYGPSYVEGRRVQNASFDPRLIVEIGQDRRQDAAT
jgi:Icc-related predicted phosphoesterase